VHCLLDEPMRRWCTWTWAALQPENILRGALRRVQNGLLYYLKEDNDCKRVISPTKPQVRTAGEDELAVLRACCLLTMIDIRRHNICSGKRCRICFFPC
jgi:hypothetical protein